jgi:DNA-directed RNA polymerase specialized sigma24 family protein
LVDLRFFAGMTISQAAEVMNLSPRTADRLWAYARAFLHSEIYSEK